MSLAEQAIKSTTRYGVINTLRYVVSTLALVGFARLLSPEVFGVVTFGIAILTAFLLLGRWGIGEALMQNDNRTDLFSTIFWLRLGFVLFLIVGIAILTLALRGRFNDGLVVVLLFMGMAKAAGTASTPFAAAIQYRFQLGRIAALDLVAVMISAGTGLWLIMQGENLYGLVAFYSVQEVVRALGHVVLSPQYPTLSFDRGTARWFLRFALSMLTSRTMNVAESDGDDILIGAIGSAATLGLYTIAWRLATAFQTVFQPPLTQAITPTFSRLKEADKQSREGVEFLLRAQLHFAVPLYIIVAVTAPELIKFVFGSKWLGAAPVLRVFAITGVLYPVATSIRQVYYSRGNADIVFRTQVYYIPVILVGIVVLVPLVGPAGAAAAMSLGQLVATTLLFNRLKEDIGVSVRRVAKPVTIASGVTVAAIFGLRLAGIYPTLSSTIAYIIASGLLVTALFFGALFTLDGPRLLEEIHILRKALT